jgi:hypothetical protein
MKKLGIVAAIATLVGSAALLFSSPASAATLCTTADPIEFETVTGDVFVPSGQECIIRSSTVNGSVFVSRDAGIAIFGSRITGSLNASQPRYVIIDCNVTALGTCGASSSIGGNVTVTGVMTNAPLYNTNTICNNVDIGGDLTINNTPAGIRWTIGGACRTPSSHPGNTIHGTFTFNKNGGAATISNNQIGKSAYVTGNTGAGSQFTNNTVAGALIVHDNCPPWTVSGNTAGGPVTTANSAGFVCP